MFLEKIEAESMQTSLIYMQHQHFNLRSIIIKKKLVKVLKTNITCSSSFYGSLNYKAFLLLIFFFIKFCNTLSPLTHY